jgi:thiol-disulfide isomerase/thioredoxin
MTRLLTRIVLVGLVAVLTAAGGYAWLRPQTAPVVSFTTLDHGIVTSGALGGKVVLLNFWSTSCDVCLKEMPRLAELHRKYQARGLETVAVAMPYDQPNIVVAYQKATRLPFKVAIDPGGEVSRRFDDVRATPTTFVIDRRGRILKRYLGEPDFAELERLIEDALARA